MEDIKSSLIRQSGSLSGRWFLPRLVEVPTAFADWKLPEGALVDGDPNDDLKHFLRELLKLDILLIANQGPSPVQTYHAAGELAVLVATRLAQSNATAAQRGGHQVRLAVTGFPPLPSVGGETYEPEQKLAQRLVDVPGIVFLRGSHDFGKLTQPLIPVGVSQG